MSKPQKYRDVAQSRGEIHVLPFKIGEEEIHAVGTYGCRTCMCVYLRFKDDTVFIAHMVAQNEPEPEEPYSSSQSSPWQHQNQGPDMSRPLFDSYEFEWTSNLAMGYNLKRMVMAQLQAKVPPRLLAEVPVEAFAVCPALYLQDRVSNAWWMREAVQDFFQVEGGIGVHRAHGFVAGSKIDTVFFQWNGQGSSYPTEQMLDSENERLPSSYNWTATRGVQEQDKLFGFVFDGAMWHRWSRWGDPHAD
ncbi:uncharacterized protein RCC_07638 [Ramularia collo-cygni]|uniref:Uncharacterized protein n=1 Tax=Ramularia collo-cygni TaxID=112498 RepID=A0A2D3VKW8_9PEZI|nr:uncharacterized protein RCC_07638 [Ramularia collo-cygni]CZT21773.1 uncharacterized protein RCC_07638 [Ramularia collo-cygni]